MAREMLRRRGGLVGGGIDANQQPEVAMTLFWLRNHLELIHLGLSNVQERLTDE